MILPLFLIAALSTDLECLYDIYDSTGGDHWLSHKNWPSRSERLRLETKSDPCIFEGVTCDDSKEVIGLRFSGLNLTGSLPPCISAMALREFDVSANRLTGEMPGLNPDHLDTLYLTHNGELGLPPNYCDMKELVTLSADHANINTKLNTCIFKLPNLQRLNLRDSGASFDITADDVIDLTRLSAVILGGVNLHGATLLLSQGTPGDLSFCNASLQNVPELADLFKQFSTSTVQVQGNRLFTRVNIENLMNTTLSMHTMELHDNYLYGIFDDGELATFVDKMDADVDTINLEGNFLTGFAPRTDEVLAVTKKHPTLYFNKLGRNPYFCRPNGDNIADCGRFTIRNATYLRGTFTIFLESNLNLPLDIVRPRLSVALKNITGSTEDDTKVCLFNREISIHTEVFSKEIIVHRLKFKISKRNWNSLGFSKDPTSDDIAVLFDEQRISTGALMANVPEEGRIDLYIDNMSKLRARDGKYVSKRVIQRPLVKLPTTSVPTVAPEHIPVDQESAAKQKVRIEVYGVSRCPDFMEDVVDKYGALVEKYPRVLEMMEFHFVSSSTLSPRYTSLSNAMHGQMEAISDRLLMCLQSKVTPNVFLDVLLCTYKTGGRPNPYNMPYGLRACMEEHVSKRQIPSIYTCANTAKANPIMQKAEKKGRENVILYSPTDFAEDRPWCTEFGCPFTTIDGMLHSICGLYKDKTGETHEIC